MPYSTGACDLFFGLVFLKLPTFQSNPNNSKRLLIINENAPYGTLVIQCRDKDTEKQG